MAEPFKIVFVSMTIPDDEPGREVVVHCHHVPRIGESVSISGGRELYVVKVLSRFDDGIQSIRVSIHGESTKGGESDPKRERIEPDIGFIDLD